MEKRSEIRDYIDYIKGRKVEVYDFIDLNEIFSDDYCIPLHFEYGLDNTASFNPNFNRINIDLDRVDVWANNMVSAAATFYEIEDLELAKAYFIVQMYKHELEHIKQFKISTDELLSSYEFLKQIYKDLFDFLVVKEIGSTSLFRFLKDDRRLRIYKKNAYKYTLERSADIESYDYVSRVAMDSNDIEIKQLMINCRNTSMLIGYMDNGDGCIKKTYEGLHMKSKYGNLHFPTSLSLVEKARYGMELDESERKTLIKTLKSTINYK